MENDDVIILRVIDDRRDLQSLCFPTPSSEMRDMAPNTKGKSGRRPASATIDAEDVARFERLGDEWWDPRGAMAALHKLNPTRIRYLRSLMARHFADRLTQGEEAGQPLAGLRLLDIGCGGGLLSEPLARLGANVTGIDPAPGNIAAAERHARAVDVAVEYRAVSAEALAEAQESFDVVLAMEVVEHVPRPDAFVRTACSLVRPGGLLVLSTLNRTAKSFLLAIVGAEYLLRWLPTGTHRWAQFLTPEELAMPVRAAGLRVIERTGVAYDLLGDRWTTSRDTGVNYMLAAARAPSSSRPPLERFKPHEQTAGQEPPERRANPEKGGARRRNQKGDHSR